MEALIAPSARKHGVADEDALHAYRNPVRVYELGEGLTMHVGADHAGNLLEVGFVTAEDSTVVIVHAMSARRNFLR